MRKWLLVFLLLPSLVSAQLKEFEVSEMERPDVAVIQANAQWPDDALLLVYSSLKDLNFRSSMGAVDKQTYNNRAGRYEILVKPVKQMLFVAKPGFIELKIATINPNPKDVFYYKVEEKQSEVVNTKPGTLKIVTEPSGADIQLNGIPVSTKTPFEGELNPGSTRIKLQKAKHETIDTTVVVKTGEPTVLNVQMKPTTVWVNISTTPIRVEMTPSDSIKRGTKQLRSNYPFKGYYDWCLPSRVEKDLMARVRRKVATGLESNGLLEISFSSMAIEFNFKYVRK